MKKRINLKNLELCVDTEDKKAQVYHNSNFGLCQPFCAPRQKRKVTKEDGLNVDKLKIN